MQVWYCLNLKLNSCSITFSSTFTSSFSSPQVEQQLIQCVTFLLWKYYSVLASWTLLHCVSLTDCSLWKCRWRQNLMNVDMVTGGWGHFETCFWGFERRTSSCGKNIFFRCCQSSRLPPYLKKIKMKIKNHNTFRNIHVFSVLQTATQKHSL